jgi:hypothetical protein
MSSFDGRVAVSARRLEELDARSKKELPEIEEIAVRARSIQAPERAERARSLPQTSLALALSPASNDGT